MSKNQTLTIQQLVHMVTAFTEVANPDVMGYVVGTDVKEVWETSNMEAVKDVFGKEFKPGLDGSISAIVAKLFLRGGTIQDEKSWLPKVESKVFFFHPAAATAGLMMDNIVNANEEDFSCLPMDGMYDEIKAITKAYGLTYEASAQILFAAHMSENTVVVVPESWYEATQDYGVDGNIHSIPDNWGSFLNFTVTKADAAKVAQQFAIACNNASIQFEVLENGQEFRLHMDGVRSFRIDDRGVYDETRQDHRFSGIIFDQAEALGMINEHPAHLLNRVNSYGTFIYALLFCGAGHYNKPSKLFRDMTSGVYAPMTNLSEVACKEGDREHYNQFVSAVRAPSLDMPFRFNKFGKPTLVKFVELSSKKVMAKKTITSIFTKYNMVEKSGLFVDGRDVSTALYLLPKEASTKLIGGLFNRLGVPVTPWMNKEFGKAFTTDTQALAWYCSVGSIVHSTKTSKAVKRTLMGRVNCGQMKYAENRLFLNLGQEEQSDNVVMMPSMLSFAATSAAGNAVNMIDPANRSENMDRISMFVKKTETSNPSPSYAGLKDLAKVVELVLVPNSITYEGKWCVANYTNLKIEAGELLAFVPFEGTEGEANHPIVSSQEDAVLKEVRWCEDTTNGNNKSVTIKIVTQTTENTLKIRGGNIKAMMTFGPRETLHNSLNVANPGLIADLILYQDTLKCKDLLMGLLDVVAATFIKNEDEIGIELIRQANLLVGYEGTDKFVYSPLVQIDGHYDLMNARFEKLYGKDLWTVSRDSETKDLTRLLNNLYSDWNVVNDMDGLFPENAVDLKIYCQDKVMEKASNLLAFYSQDGVPYVAMRNWAYCGDETTGPVWVAIKGEVSAVADITGNTPVMGGVVRAISKSNPVWAAKMMKGGHRKLHIAGAFKDMLEAKVIQGTTGVPLKDIRILLSDETKAMMVDPSTYSSCFEAVAQDLREVTIVVGSFSLYIPAIYKQDANRSFKSAQGLSDLVLMFLLGVVMGVDADSLLALSRRIKGALESTSKGDGLGKAASYGCDGVQAKASAPILGIPVGEVWVKMSGSRRSVYSWMSRTYSTVDGATVAIARSPMVEPLYAKVVVIAESHWAFDYMEEFTMSLSPLGMIMNSGDFDGDNVAAFEVEGISASNYDTLECELVTLTGSPQYQPGGVSWSDQWNLPTKAKQDRKNGKGDGILAHLSLGVKFKEKEANKKSFPHLLEVSSEALTIHVGNLHGMFLTGDLACAIAREVGLSEGFEWMLRNGVAGILSQAYEVPLGGYEPMCYALVVALRALQIDEKVVATCLEGMNVNPSFTSEVVQAAYLVRDCKASVGKLWAVENQQDLLAGLIQLSIIVSKNDDTYTELAPKLMEYAKANIDEWNFFASKSISVHQIQLWLQVSHGCLNGKRLVDINMIS